MKSSGYVFGSSEAEKQVEEIVGPIFNVVGLNYSRANLIVMILLAVVLLLLGVHLARRKRR